MNSSRPRTRVPCATALLIATTICGCASGPPEESFFIRYQFTGGDYAKLLEDTFGDDARSGVHFFVLRNAWSHVEPNGLLLTPGRARYVWEQDGTVMSVDRTPASCSPLGPLLADFDTALDDAMDHATGLKPFPVGTGDVLDPPDYVIEVHGPYANIVIEPKGSVPSIVVARKIRQAMMQCYQE